MRWQIAPTMVRFASETVDKNEIDCMLSGCAGILDSNRLESSHT